MNDSSFVLFLVAALFLVAVGWYIVLQEWDFQEQDRAEEAAHRASYQRRYSDRIVVLTEKEQPRSAASGR